MLRVGQLVTVFPDDAVYTIQEISPHTGSVRVGRHDGPRLWTTWCEPSDITHVAESGVKVGDRVQINLDPHAEYIGRDGWVRVSFRDGEGRKLADCEVYIGDLSPAIGA